MNTFKTARRAAIEHSFLAASIVAAGALFRDSAGEADAVHAPRVHEPPAEGAGSVGPQSAAGWLDGRAIAGAPTGR